MSAARTMGSDYMRWAKTLQQARFTLATSGVAPLSLEELGADWDDLALDTSDRYGWGPLRAAIGALYGVGADRVVTAAGTSGANHLAMATLIAPGDEVIVEDPVYETVLALAMHLGAAVRFLPRRHERGFRIDPDDLRGAITPRTKLVVLTNLHNPSSSAIDAPTLAAIGEIAAHHGARVIMDEVYLDAAFEAAPPSAATLGEVFVVTASLTKVCGLGGLRGGWIVADPTLVDRMWSVKSLFGVDEPHVAERLTLVALRERPRLLARSRSILDANRAAWNAFLGARQADLAAEPSLFGTTSFPLVRLADGDTLERHLRARYETSVVPGRCFRAPGHVRVGLAGRVETFREGLARLGAALDDLREGRVSSAT